NAVLDQVVYLGIENLVVTGTIGPDSIFAGAGNDYVYGGGGNDIIFGGTGADTLFADEGDDFVAYGTDANYQLSDSTGLGMFLIDGGQGIDTLSLSLAGRGDNISLFGTDGTQEITQTNISFQDGGAVTNFEILRDIRTGTGDDQLGQVGRFDNNF